MVSDDGEVIMKFRRQDIADALTQNGEELDTEFEVRGTFKLNNQIYIFKGIDTIKKVLPESVPPKKK